MRPLARAGGPCPARGSDEGPDQTTPTPLGACPQREPKPITEQERKDVRRKEAKLLGVFSAPNYVDVYDGKTTVPYGETQPERSNFRDLPPIKKGEDEIIRRKQWLKTNPGREGKTPDVYFQHALNLAGKKPSDDSGDKDAWKKEYAKTHDQYQDKVAYNRDALDKVVKKEGGDGAPPLNEIFHGAERTTYQQKMKQFKGSKQKVGDDLMPVMGTLRGFQSSDFAKRDEFTLTFRTEQYREQLKQEDVYAKKGIELAASLGNGPTEEQLASARATMQRKEPPALYDLVFEKPELTADARDTWFKVKKDTLNPTHLSKARDVGTYRTTNRQHFAPPPEHEKPEFGHKPIMRDTFYRKTNVFFPKGAAAEPKS